MCISSRTFEKLGERKVFEKCYRKSHICENISEELVNITAASL